MVLFSLLFLSLLPLISFDGVFLEELQVLVDFRFLAVLELRLNFEVQIVSLKLSFALLFELFVHGLLHLLFEGVDF